MNASPHRVDLASEPEFGIGNVRVRPALRAVDFNGLSEILEPRVMQVLITLALRRGEVVGRHELASACWEVFVGEDAIQRAVARVRGLGNASGAFSIETIRKVGYMLMVQETSANGGQALPHPQNDRAALAILPFINRSGSESGDILAANLVSDLSAAAAFILEQYYLSVVAPSVAAAHLGACHNPQQIGQDLGVHYLLEGDVRQAGNSLRVSVQLAEGETGKILWAQKFDYPTLDVDAPLENFVTELAVQLCGQVERLEIADALRSTTNSSWDAQKRALAYMAQNTRSGCEAGFLEAKRSTEIDPDSANAHAFLAAMLGRLLFYGCGDGRQLESQLLDAVQDAIRLDPNNHGVLGGTAAALADLGKLEDALLLAQRALAINPNFAAGKLILGSILVRLGRAEEALPQLEAMERLAPNSLWFYRSLIWRSAAHLGAGRSSLALEAADTAIRLATNVESVSQYLLCLTELDDRDRARETLLRYRDLNKELSGELLQVLVQNINRGSGSVDKFVALIGNLWDEVLI